MGAVESFPEIETGRAVPGNAPEEAGRRAAAAALAERFAVELQRSARNARTRGRAPRLRLQDLRAMLPSVGPSGLRRLPSPGVLAMVVAPSLAAFLYFGVLASSVYETQARFAVRTAALSAVDAFTSLSGVPSVNQIQDSLIVANFVTSPAAVEELERTVGLRDRFARENIDVLSRLRADAPAERLAEFWRGKVDVAIESPSGIITVRVRAFSADDAHAIAGALVSSSEALVNRLGAQAREDLVADTARELAEIEARLETARAALADLRRDEGVIDPQLTVEGLTTLINGLRSELVRLEQEIATSVRTVGAEAPQLAPLRARRSAIEEQMTALQAELTSRRADGREAIASVMTRFDQLALERQVLERQYATAAAALEHARASAARQQMYLATFVEPVLPQEAVGPRRLLTPLLISVLLAVLWGAGASALARWRAQRL